MLRQSLTASLPGLTLALCALGLVGYARFVLGYPICPNDEQNYVAILERLDQGARWPVSGPAFVFINQLLSRATGLSFAATVALIGTLAVPVLVFVTYRLYLSVAGEAKAAFLSVLVLFASSYFLGPLIESRPQQVGQFLVLAACLALYRRGRGHHNLAGFAVLYALTASYHILSWAVLTGAALLLWSGRFALGSVSAASSWQFLLALSPGLAIVLFPSGPYEVMLLDIRRHHVLLTGEWALLAGIAILVVAVLSLLLLRRHATAWPQGIQRLLAGLGGVPVQIRLVATTAVVALVLTVQYSLLHERYAANYADSMLRFLSLQAGNLLFLGLLLWGSLRAMDAYVEARWPTWLSPFAALGLIFAAMGVATLLVSPFLLDKNLLIRLMGYALLFAAPFACYGLATLPPRLRSLVLLSLPAAAALSLMHGIKHPAWMVCVPG